MTYLSQLLQDPMDESIFGGNRNNSAVGAGSKRGPI